MVTAFSAATADDWQWIPIGVDLGDVNTLIAAHNGNANAHDTRFNALQTAYEAMDATIVTDYQAADATLTAAVAALEAIPGLTIAPYSAQATYVRGGTNSVVTDGSGLYIYVSATSRSSNHDPGQHPAYWFEISEGVSYQVISEIGAVRMAARTLLVFAQNDRVFLCTTAQTTPRDQAYIISNSGLGQEFIELNAPTSLVGLSRVWEFNQNTRGQVRSKGDLDEYQGAWYVNTIDHTPGISPFAEPGVNPDFKRIDNDGVMAVFPHNRTTILSSLTISATAVTLDTGLSEALKPNTLYEILLSG